MARRQHVIVALIKYSFFSLHSAALRHFGEIADLKKKANRTNAFSLFLLLQIAAPVSKRTGDQENLLESAVNEWPGS